jgi:hypothetical protein
MGLSFNLGRLSPSLFTDSSLNVGIGAAPSGSYKLEVTGTGRFTGALTYPKFIMSGGSDQSELTNAVNNDFKLTNSGNFRIINNSNTVALLTVTNAGAATFSSGVTALSGIYKPIDNATEAIRIYRGNSSAYLNESAIFDASGGMTNIRNNALDSVRSIIFSFSTDGSTTYTERMRITSGGDLCLGTTSGTGLTRFLAINSASSSGVILKYNDSNNGYLYNTSNSLRIESAGGNNIYVQVNGTAGVVLTTGATSWASASDERLKNINSNIDNALNKLLTLRAINFSWKNDETNKENLGLIAQEVEKVFPQIIGKSSISNGLEKNNSDDTEYLNVRYTELIPVLVKAIQELNERLNKAGL